MGKEGQNPCIRDASQSVRGSTSLTETSKEKQVGSHSGLGQQLKKSSSFSSRADPRNQGPWTFADLTTVAKKHILPSRLGKQGRQ